MKTNVRIFTVQNGFTGDGFMKQEGPTFTVCLRGDVEGDVYWCAEDAVCPLTEHRGNVVFYRGPAPSGMPENAAIVAVRGDQAICLLGVGNFQRLTEDFAQKRGLKIGDIVVGSSTKTPKLPAETEAAIPAKQEPKEAVFTLQEAIPPAQVTPQAVTEGPPVESLTEAWAPPAPLTPPSSFWACNAQAMEQLFAEHPAEEELAMLIPGSRWAQVENAGAPYIVGTIYDEDKEPLFLCYGFPMPWSEEPPEKLEGYSQWVPKDFAHPRDDGYWMIYVNARTGERVM